MIYPQSGVQYMCYDEDGNMQFPPELKLNVEFISVFNGTDYVPVGTAFWLGIEEGDSWFTYLVTCKHVVEPFLKQGHKLYLRSNRTDIRAVGHEELPGDWVYHKDPAVDIAVLAWTNTVPKPYYMAVFNADLLLLHMEDLQRAKHTIREGDDVVFVGLFAQYAGYTRNYPVVRWGRIALVTDEPLYVHPYGAAQYLFIEAQVYPGFSGSPLYIALDLDGKIQLKLMGIVSGYYPDQQPIYVDPNTYQIFTHFGISVAIPDDFIEDVLQGDVLKEKRKQKVGAKNKATAPAPAANIVPEDTGAFTREDFISALRKASSQNPQPDSKTSGTSG